MRILQVVVHVVYFVFVASRHSDDPGGRDKFYV